MAMFQQYQGGIAPVQGISEAGARIGQTAGAGLADAGKSLAEGIQAYHENTAKWDMASSEADVLAGQIAKTQSLFLSHPAYKPLADALSPYVDELSKVKTLSLPKALAVLNSAKAGYSGTMQQFPLYDAVRKEREYGVFGEGATDPNNTTVVRQVPVGTAPKDLIWDYTTTLDKNIFAASSYYDRYKQANPSVKLRDKTDWLKSWLSTLPSQIANDTKVEPFVRQKAIENINNAVSKNLFKLRDTKDYYSDNPREIPEYNNPNAPLPSSINRMAQMPEAPASPYGNFSDKPIDKYHINPVTGALEVLPPAQDWRKPMDTIVTTADGITRKVPTRTESGVNIYLPDSTGQIAPYSPEVYAYAEAAGVSAKDFVDGQQASGLSLDQYYLSITTPAGEVSPNIAIPDRGTPAVPVPVAPAPTPAKPTQPVTPPVAKPSTEPKVSAPTPAYSGKALTPAPAQAQAPAPVKATAPARPAPASAPAQATAPATQPEVVIPEQLAPTEPEPQAQQEQVNIPEQLKPSEEVQANVAPSSPPTKSTSIAPNAPDPDAPQRKYDEPMFGKLSVARGSYDEASGRPASSAYTIAPDSERYQVKRGEQIWQIGNRMGVHHDAVAELNGLPVNITPDELWRVAKQRGGLYIPKKVNKEDLPEKLRNNPRIVMNGSSGGRFAAVLPPDLSRYTDKKAETPQETTDTSYKPSAPLGSKEITPVGEGVISPEQDEANRVASGMSKDDWAKVKVSRSHIQTQKNEAWNKKYAYSGSLDWLRTMRDSVADGKSELVDFGPYGQWESIHPEAALGVEVGFDAATILFGATKTNKIIQGKKLIDREKMVTESAKKAFEAIQKSRAEALAKGPKMIGAGGQVGATLERRTAQRLATEEAKLFEDALKKAGVTVDADIKAKIAGMNKDVYLQMAKTTFWTSFFEGMYGTRNESPYNANSDPETRAYLNTTLDGVRKLRTGYFPAGLGQGEGWFGVNEALGGWTPLTGKEQIDIVKYLDEKIAQGQVKLDNYDASYKAAFTDLADNQKLLSRYADISSGSPNANDVDTAYKPSAPLGTNTSIIGSKSFETERTTDEKRMMLRNFMQKRLGYVPQGFDSMFNTQFPEATLKMQETPYGVMYHSGGEWKPLPTSKGNTSSFSDVAKEKSVTFGEPLPSGGFKPTEFIKGSGIKLGGIGSFGSAEAASKFRETYPKLIAAKKIANQLKELNEQTFRSFSPDKWGTAAAKVSQLIASMRVALIGVGSVSDYEQQLMKELVQDPTAFFSLQSTTRAKYNAMLEKIEDELQTMPQSFGLTVELDKDKADELQAARRAYQEFTGWSQLSPQERAKIKASIK